MGLGLLVRLSVVGWAWGSFPPVADGSFYQVVAARIASGQGYTWLWPDGVVTHAAHYPVGYPALVGALYAVLGAEPEIAMLLNAVLGALAVLGAHRLAAAVSTRRGAVLGALAVALHPGLVAYTPALMTEGVVAALLVIAGGLVAEARLAVTASGGWAWRVALGVLLGLAVLVRPQNLLAVPLLGLAAAGRPGWLAAGRSSVAVTLLALSLVLPWTLRNCFTMGTPGRFTPSACLLVSANAGWNLFIGASPGATGQWVALDRLGVPDECVEVYGEADKDRCFGQAGLRHLRAEPVRWLGLIPAKLGATFDGCGAASYYLHASNPERFGLRLGRWLDGLETLWQRLSLLAGLFALWWAGTITGGGVWRPRWPLASLLMAAMVAAFTRQGWIAYLLLPVGVLGLGRALPRHAAACVAGAVVATTLLSHAVFFGAGRYSMVTFGVLGALAGSAWLDRSRWRAESSATAANG